MDDRFIRLVGLEARAAGGRPLVFAIIGAALAIVGCLLWALVCRDPGAGVTSLQYYVVTLAATARARGVVADLGQMSFGYEVLCSWAYAVSLVAKLVLPWIASDSVNRDRAMGRLAELSLTLITPRQVYLAKSLAYMGTMVIPAAVLLLVGAPVLFGECVPLIEITRLSADAVGQVAVASVTTLACSAAFRWTWGARIAAYSVLWVFVPALWEWVVCGKAGIGRAIVYWLPEPRFPTLHQQSAVLGVFTMVLLAVVGLFGAAQMGRAMRRDAGPS